MPVYHITHSTRYRHAAPAAAAWQSLHLQPRRESIQHCDAFELEIAPHPRDLSSHVDFFGNKQHVFTLHEPHTELVITSRSVVTRHEPALPMSGLTPTPAEIPALVESAIVAGDFSLEQYLHPSPLVPLLPDAAALAGEFGPGADVPFLEWLGTVGERFHEAFTYAPQATTISTSLDEVLSLRHGVCQDFAHVMISCLRQQGVPAAYVSGYLLTNPPPGQPRLRGADASHAWISAFVPGIGWIDYDPTNACFVGAGHIVVARGRDFADISPVKGLFNGGTHQLVTEVTVEPAN